MNKLTSELKTHKVNQTHYATLRILGIPGGFIGHGVTVQLAIMDAYNKYNWHKLTERNQQQLEEDNN